MIKDDLKANCNKCTNPDIGIMRAGYQFQTLTEEETKSFENHLYTCQYCFNDLGDHVELTFLIQGAREHLHNRRIEPVKASRSFWTIGWAAASRLMSAVKGFFFRLFRSS